MSMIETLSIVAQFIEVQSLCFDGYKHSTRRDICKGISWITFT